MSIGMRFSEPRRHDQVPGDVGVRTALGSRVSWRPRRRGHLLMGFGAAPATRGPAAAARANPRASPIATSGPRSERLSCARFRDQESLNASMTRMGRYLGRSGCSRCCWRHGWPSIGALLRRAGHRRAALSARPAPGVRGLPAQRGDGDGGSLAGAASASPRRRPAAGLTVCSRWRCGVQPLLERDRGGVGRGDHRHAVAAPPMLAIRRCELVVSGARWRGSPALGPREAAAGRRWGGTFAIAAQAPTWRAGFGSRPGRDRPRRAVGRGLADRPHRPPHVPARCPKCGGRGSRTGPAATTVVVVPPWFARLLDTLYSSDNMLGQPADTSAERPKLVCCFPSRDQRGRVEARTDRRGCRRASGDHRPHARIQSIRAWKVPLLSAGVGGRGRGRWASARVPKIHTRLRGPNETR